MFYAFAFFSLCLVFLRKILHPLLCETLSNLHPEQLLRCAGRYLHFQIEMKVNECINIFDRPKIPDLETVLPIHQWKLIVSTEKQSKCVWVVTLGENEGEKVLVSQVANIIFKLTVIQVYDLSKVKLALHRLMDPSVCSRVNQVISKFSSSTQAADV